MHDPDNPNRPSLSEAAAPEARQWSMWIHLSGLCHFLVPIPGASIIVPLILWSMKKDDSPYIDDHGKEAVNFQISILLYFIASVALCLVLIGFFLIPAVAVFQLVACIIAGLKANEGGMIRYPLNIRFIS
ncbi:MAG: DUF4870 domain-containing protein [Planctomycetota bacterium]